MGDKVGGEEGKKEAKDPGAVLKAWEQTDWSEEEQGRHPGDEGRRAREGIEGMLGIFPSPTGNSVLQLSCRNLSCSHPLMPIHSSLERVLGKQ